MRFPFGIYQVEGNSMEPSLRSGQRVVVFHWQKGHLGDVVVFKKNAKTMIKRIQKMDGSHVTVHGDHSESTDSRDFGSIQRSRILGKVLF